MDYLSFQQVLAVRTIAVHYGEPEFAADLETLHTLATGVFLALCAALVTEGNFLFLHLLLAFWVLAHLVEIGSQLVLYQRGV